MAEISIITSEGNWLESAALRQLESIAGYPGVTRVAGLPDLHAGRTPVGLAVVSEGHIYPYLIGNDIGCGMGLFKTGLLRRKFKLEKYECVCENTPSPWSHKASPIGNVPYRKMPGDKDSAPKSASHVHRSGFQSA